MSWLRLDEDIDTHPQIADAAEDAWLALPAFTAALRIIKRHGRAGRVTGKYLTARHVARRLAFPRDREADVQAALDALVAHGALDQDGEDWIVPGWSRYQADPTADERTARWRDKEGRGANPHKTVDELRGVTRVTPDVTGQDVTGQYGTEREEESSPTEPTAPAAPVDDRDVHLSEPTTPTASGSAWQRDCERIRNLALAAGVPEGQATWGQVGKLLTAYNRDADGLAQLMAPLAAAEACADKPWRYLLGCIKGRADDRARELAAGEAQAEARERTLQALAARMRACAHCYWPTGYCTGCGNACDDAEIEVGDVQRLATPEERAACKARLAADEAALASPEQAARARAIVQQVRAALAGKPRVQWDEDESIPPGRGKPIPECLRAPLPEPPK